MKITRRTKLLVIALVLCVTTMIGSTFAWFTDSVTNNSNRIESGTLELQVLYQDGVDWKDIEENPVPLFNYSLWEPGYAVVKGIEIKNTGTLALKYKVNFELTAKSNKAYKLEDVIDVYLFNEEPARSDFVEDAKVGTLADLIYGEDVDGTVHGKLTAKGTATATTGKIYIGLKMRETAGNKYQKLNVGNGFNLVVVATQDTVEEDSFDNQYDKDATYPVFKDYVMKLHAGHTQTTREIPVSGDFTSTLNVMASITGRSLYDDNNQRITNSVIFRFSDVAKQTIDENSYKVSLNLAVLDDQGKNLALKGGSANPYNPNDPREYLYMYLNLLEVPADYAVSAVKVNDTDLTKTTNSDPATGEYMLGSNAKDVYLQSTTAGLIEVIVSKTK